MVATTTAAALVATTAAIVITGAFPNANQEPRYHAESFLVIGFEEHFAGIPVYDLLQILKRPALKVPIHVVNRCNAVGLTRVDRLPKVTTFARRVRDRDRAGEGATSEIDGMIGRAPEHIAAHQNAQLLFVLAHALPDHSNSDIQLRNLPRSIIGRVHVRADVKVRVNPLDRRSLRRIQGIDRTYQVILAQRIP